MKKMIALLVAAVFVATTGLAEAAPKKSGSGRIVATKTTAKAKKAHARKSKQHKRVLAAKHGKPVMKHLPTKHVTDRP